MSRDHFANFSWLDLDKRIDTATLTFMEFEGAMTRRAELRAAATTRRRFLTGTGAAAWLAATGALSGVATPASAETAAPGAYPFTLAVASGDPLPDAVVIWTRLAPDPFVRFGGMPQANVAVQWQVAEDEHFRRIVRSGRATARPEYSHTVHVDVRGLRPWRPYFYRFRVGRHVSPVGRTRTAPSASQRPQAISLALASCQKWDDGFYTAHRDLAARDHDVVLFVGDYIYETHLQTGGGVRGGSRPDAVDQEALSLDEYRLRYTLHKLDPDLQAAHAASAWVVTWDDHEVENNWCGPYSLDLDAAEFVVRRANAMRAYWEHMPLRQAQTPQGPDMQLYRRLRYGTLADLLVLDTRQYRSNQVAKGAWVAPSDASRDPSRTITGDVQEKWILDSLGSSTARWKVLVQQVLMMPVDKVAGPEVASPMGTWEGYSASRDRVLNGLTARGVDNLVVLTGDVHNNFAGDLKADFADPSSAPIGAEFVTTSISSGGDGADQTTFHRTILAEGPHVKFANGQRGYVSCRVTDEAWTADYRVADRVETPGGTVTSRARFLVQNGIAGVQAA